MHVIHYSLRTYCTWLDYYATCASSSANDVTFVFSLDFRRLTDCAASLIAFQRCWFRLINIWSSGEWNSVSTGIPSTTKKQKKQQWSSLMVPASLFFFFFGYTFLFLLELSSISSFIVCSIRHAGPFQPQIKQNKRPENRFIDHHFSILPFIFFFSSNE